MLDSFISFIRSADPNPDKAFLKARGYEESLKLAEKNGRWEPATKKKLTLRVLDWPKSRNEGFRDVEQCEALGLGLDYYLK